MEFLDLTLPTAVENLALDEALLLKFESADNGQELLRLWEPEGYSVVLGISGKMEKEVHVDQCEHADIPVLRRSSGGGTVVLGPGCLNYSLILSYEERPDCLDLTVSYRTVMSKIAQALGHEVLVLGISDLARETMKFSGNAQRRLQRYFLHHGTLLYDFNLEIIEELLKHPAKQPDYREQRRHRDFVGNLGLDQNTIKERLKNAFSASHVWSGELPDTQALIDEKYGQRAWTYRR
jgi:lipoate---protein ligase